MAGNEALQSSEEQTQTEISPGAESATAGVKIDAGVELEGGAENLEGSDTEKSETTENSETTGLTPNAHEAINKQHRLFKDEQRARQSLEAQITELQGKLKDQTGSEVAPVVPPMPDPFDDNFATLMETRDAALIAKSTFDSALAVRTSQSEQQQREAVTARQTEINQKAETFDATAKSQGFAPAELEAASQVVASYAIAPELAEFLLGRVDGPAVTTYLAQNPVELESIASMSPIAAAIFINDTVAGKAKSVLPKSSAAPDPLELLDGKGKPDTRHPALATTSFK